MEEVSPTSKEVILIVDDDPNILELLQTRLELEGYHTICAQGGHEAMRIVGRQPPDLILLDIMMPEMSGIEVCQRIKAEPETQALPIIMATARTSPEDIVEGLEAGADDYVTKPFVTGELLARVRAAL
ncbi:unnamed protein product, partial [marine sediment metagenome]